MAEETKIGIKLEEEMKPLKKICEHLEEAVKTELAKGIESVDAEEMGKVVDMIKDVYEAKEKMVKACYYKQIMEAMEEHDFEDEEEIMEEGRRGYRGQPRSQSGRFMSRGDGRRSNRGRSGRRGYEEPMYFTMTPEMYREHDPEWYRDMDREEMGRMYYSGGSSGSSSMGSGSSSGMSGGSQSGGQSGAGSSRGYEEGYSRGYEEGSRGNQRDGREGRSGRSRRSYMETKEMNKGNSSEEKQMKMKELEKYIKELSEDVTEMIGDASPEEKSMLKTKLQTLTQKI